MAFGKAIYQYREYILVAIITAIIVVLIYPYTVRHGSLSTGHDDELKKWHGYNSAWTPMGLLQRLKLMWSPLKRRRKRVITSLLLTLIKEYGQPWMKRLEDFVTPGVAVDLADVTQEARMFSLLTNYDYGPTSFLPPHYRRVTAEDTSVWRKMLNWWYKILGHNGEMTAVGLAVRTQEAGMFSLLTNYYYGPTSFLPPHYRRVTAEVTRVWWKMLNWWYKMLGHNEYEDFSLAKAFMNFLDAAFLPLASIMLFGPILCIVGICRMGQNSRKLKLNYSYHIPPIKIKDENGRMVTLHFELHNVLGYGAYGKIQEVSRRGSRKIYVVKTVKKVDTDKLNIKTTKSLAALKTVGRVDRIYLEKRILELARDCPFLTHLLWAVETDVYMHLITPLHRGGDMWQFLEIHGRLEESVVQFIMAEVVCALEFLHERGIVHRDLKLENIMIDADGHIRLIDFGLAAENVYNSEKILYDQCGSPITMAPEILNKHIYNESCDWWSAGVMMYWIHMGDPPFDGETVAEIVFSVRNDEPHWNRYVDYKIKDCIRWFLEKEPDYRLGMRECPVGEIRDQHFFKDLDWELADTKGLSPPSILEFAPKDFVIDENENETARDHFKKIKEIWFKMLNWKHLSTVIEGKKQ